jgi:hypothetical protein
MLRTFVHLVLHITAPAAVSRFAFASQWRRAWLIMVATMIVDLDHLLSMPVFDPDRCSINFHPLHTWPAILGYLLLTACPKFRIVGVGLLLHMGLDGLDCMWMQWCRDALASSKF